MVDVECVKFIGPLGRWTAGGSDGVGGLLLEVEAAVVAVEINEDIAGIGVDGLEMGGEAFTGAFDDESIIGTEGCCGCCCMTTCWKENSQIYRPF